MFLLPTLTEDGSNTIHKYKRKILRVILYSLTRP